VSGERSAIVAGLVAAVASLLGCRTVEVESRAPADQVRQIEQTLDTLYRAFCFDAGGDADWPTMRSLFLDGASFVAPVRDGMLPRAVQADQFIEDFQSWIASSSEGETGLHERIEHLRIDVYGTVAHAYVLFEAFVPGDQRAVKRGIDSIQLVRAGEHWLVASLTTQFANGDLPVPTRFEGS